MALSNSQPADTPINLVIFDCDGVLIDSETLSKEVLLLMLEKLGVYVSDAYFESYFLGQSFPSVRDRICTDYDVLLPEDFQTKYLAELLQVFEQRLTPTENLDSVLAKLNTLSCVATSSSPERVRFALKTTGLSHHFTDRVFTSSEVKRGKPAPDLFLHAAAKMEVPSSQCLVIEDSQAGIRGALAANMRVIRYAGGSHLKNNPNAQPGNYDNVETIFDWNQFFELYPALNQHT